MAIVQAFTWTLGMTIMSDAMHWVGLLGALRRSSISTYGDAAQAVGGTILFLGIILILIIFANLAWFAPKGDEEFPVADVAEDAKKIQYCLKTEKFGSPFL